MSSKSTPPEVNAGSMADIAFLLLIFFLVTTVIPTDAGLDRQLPRKDKTQPDPPPIHHRNILTVVVGENNQILVEEEVVPITALRKIAREFLDNGGATPNGEVAFCDYCLGARDVQSSDNPDKAVISLKSNRKALYGTYITVQNELVGAYNELRDREAQRLYQMDYTAMDAKYNDAKTSKKEKETLRMKIKEIQALFPLKLSEAETIETKTKN
ncbi:ExbD/TolR family protein [Spongiimicrobium salis]|uniref:ExbD/TolR family protein n=1 Tax=Spongiimicrobium salis TaxID=1667022 RepID=UPI00374DB927